MISFELEILGFLVAGAYGYVLQLPFSAYGEALILLLQSLVLVGYVYHYAKVPIARRMATGAMFAGALGYLTSGAPPGAAGGRRCSQPWPAPPPAPVALLPLPLPCCGRPLRCAEQPGGASHLAPRRPGQR